MSLFSMFASLKVTAGGGGGGGSEALAFPVTDSGGTYTGASGVDQHTVSFPETDEAWIRMTVNANTLSSGAPKPLFELRLDGTPVLQYYFGGTSYYWRCWNGSSWTGVIGANANEAAATNQVLFLHVKADTASYTSYYHGLDYYKPAYSTVDTSACVTATFNELVLFNVGGTSTVISDIYVGDPALTSIPNANVQVKALLGFNGTDAATSFTDESITGTPVTFNGNAQLDTAQKKFGSASLLLDGSGDYISLGTGSNFRFEYQRPLTIEGWFRWNSNPSAVQHLMGRWTPTGNLRSYRLVYDGTTGQLQFRYSSNGTNDNLMGSAYSWTPTIGTWYHIAITQRISNHAVVFLDGVSVIGPTALGALNNPAAQFTIGADGDGAGGFNGWVDEFRFTNYYNHYEAAFVPRTEPFPRPVVTTAKVVLIAGQSNARSYDTTGSDVTAGIDAVFPDSGVKIWNTQTDMFETYEPGVNSDTWNSGASTPQKWGPEAGFAKDFRAANPGTDLYMIKMAVDSTTLYGVVGDDWNPASTGELFDDMTALIVAALAALSLTPEVRALLLMQGEWDGDNTTYSVNYGISLTDFITAVRSEWGDAATKVVLGRISGSTQWSSHSAVRGFQALIPKQMSDVVMIDTDSYTRAVDDKHYVAASVQTLGEDMFDGFAGSYPTTQAKFGPTTQDRDSNVTLSNSNLTADGSGTGTGYQTARCDRFLYGKCYVEFQIDLQTGSINVGMGKSLTGFNNYWGSGSDNIGYSRNGGVFKNGSSIATYATWTAGDRIMLAFDSATGNVWFGKNGTWNGDPSAGTGAVATLSATTTSSLHRCGVTLRRSSDRITLKTKSTDWLYAAPTGFSAP